MWFFQTSVFRFFPSPPPYPFFKIGFQVQRVWPSCVWLPLGPDVAGFWVLAAFFLMMRSPAFGVPGRISPPGDFRFSPSFLHCVAEVLLSLPALGVVGDRK